MMRLADADIRAYEGLVFSTARMYADYLDLDMEDVQQILRLKVAKALCAFKEERRSTRFGVKEAERRWVFGAVRNQVKDLLKGQSRLNDARQGGQLYIEDVSGEGDTFHRRYLMEDEERAFGEVLDEMPKLPSTLTELETQVVELLLLDYNQTQISRELGVSRTKIREAHASVRVKLLATQPQAVAEMLVRELQAAA